MALADTARLIASLELQDKFSGPARKAEGSLGSLDKRMSALSASGRKLGAGLGHAFSTIAKIGAVGVGAAAVGLAASVNAASDLNEEIDKSQVVFGKAADELFRFADGAAEIGLSKAEALGAAGAFGNMFNTVGLAQNKSADMSKTMVQLAADMASFNNEDPSDMLDRLRSGLSGEAEPLRRFGVLLSEASVKEFAYRKGIAKTGEALTEAQKVQARYGLILEQTELQQGNFADTSDSLANQQRQLSANLRNTASTIGQALLPTVGRLAHAINELFIDKQPQIEKFGKRIGRALESVFTNKNIDKGMDAIGGFIDDLAKGGADGGGLKNVASNIGNISDKLGALPWQSIGDAAKLLGTGSKALLDAFLDMPPWVQTAVLTGWGLNKLTGGALGGIVGELAKGLVKGILGINAGTVIIKAGTVTGGGGGLPATGGGGARGAAQSVGSFLAKLIPVIGAAELGANLAGGTGPVEAFLTPDKQNLVIVKDAEARADRLNKEIADVDRRLEEVKSSSVTNKQAVVAALNAEKAELIRARNSIVQTSGITRSAIDRSAATARAGFTDNGAKLVRVAGSVDSARGAIGTSNAHLAAIERKKSSVHVTVNNTTSIAISASQMQTRITQLKLTTDSEQWINEAIT